jgi:hypothetical protein
VLVLWAAAACVAGAFRLLAQLPAPAIPIAILVGIAYGCAVRVPWVGEALRSLGIRGILAVHLGRFVGLYFLRLQAEGRLPAEFAERAGWGDIVAAAGALALIPWRDGPGFGRALAFWNWVGLIDLLVAVATAAWLNLTRPGSMAELSTLPLTLVPLFLVPILLTSHLVLMQPRRVANPPDPGHLQAGFPR